LLDKLSDVALEEQHQRHMEEKKEKETREQ